jgi:capsular exopolysaccharide synthesis family protein
MPNSRTISDEHPTTLGDATRVAARFLKSHRTFLFLFTIAGTVLGYAALSLVTPQYRGRAVLTIDAPNAQFLAVPSMTRDATLELPLVETQAQMLRSPELASRVIDQLGLRKDEELNPSAAVRSAQDAKGIRAVFFRVAGQGHQLAAAVGGWLTSTKRRLGLEAEDPKPPFAFESLAQSPNDDPVVRRFLDRQKVATIDKSNAFTVEYSSKNPYVAAEVANAMARAFIASEIEQKRLRAVEASASLTPWLADLKARVLRAEHAAAEFRADAGLTKVNEATLPEHQLADVNKQLISARADRLQAEARLQQLKRSTVDSTQASPDVLRSPLIQALRQQESEIMRRLAELSTVYGDKHPAVRNVRSELANVRKKINEEINRIGASLQDELATARGREELLDSNLQKLEQRTTKLNGAAVRLNELEREADALRSVYKQILPRVTEIQLQAQHETSNVRLAAASVVPTSPYFPKKRPAMMAVTLGSFLAALGIALVRERIFRGFSFTDEVQHATGLPVIALLPTVSGRRLAAPEVVAAGKADPFFREALRSVQTALLLTSQDTAKTVLVTSSVSGEGKSSLSAALATQMARAGRRCLLIDCDLRMPTAHKILGLRDDAGLLQYLAGQISRDELVQVHRTGLHFIASGASAFHASDEERSDSPPDLLTSYGFRGLLRSLSVQYDVVVIDSPPALALSDVEILASLADRIIYAVRWRKTGRDTVMAALQRTAGATQARAAIVLTQVDTKWYASSASTDGELYSRKHRHYLQRHVS